MSMRQFTAHREIYRDKIRTQPMPTTPAKRPRITRPAYKLANKSIGVLKNDHANFTSKQILQGASILTVLEIAKAHRLRVPEIDEICQAAKTHFARSNNGQVVSVRGLRFIFRMLVKHKYIKKG